MGEMHATPALPIPESSAPGDSAVDGRPRRHDDSMLLLRGLVEDSLDEGYARAATRRAAALAASTPGEAAPRAHRRGWLLAAALLGVGLLLATSYAQARDRAGSAAAAHDALVAEVTSRADANEAAQRNLDGQRAGVAREQRRTLELSGAGTALSVILSRLESVTGAGPVAGPGLVVRLDDAPAAAGGSDVDPRTDGTTKQGRVTDRDLQTVVNEVWAAGAEAVAVGGQRLTALSAIRSAGDAVLVDFRPLSPPYEVVAVGDPATLRSRFVDGFGGSYLQVLRKYGITTSVTDKKTLRLPASAGVTLRHATVASAKAVAAAEAAGAAAGSGSRGDTP